MGQRIFEEEQQGKERADYGAYLLQNLAKRLEPEFGSGFGFATMRGSEANDTFCVEDGRVLTRTNHNGGINGGISNGMPVVFNCAVKPTPSIAKEQQTVNYITGQNQSLNLKGRHDPAIIRRICIVVSSLMAIVLCDVLSGARGTDYLK